MSQDPLATLRRAQPRPRGTFPDAMYDSEVLQPLQQAIDPLFEEAVIDVVRAHVIVLGETRAIEPTVVVRMLSGLDALPETVPFLPHHPLSGLLARTVAATGAEAGMATATEEIAAAAMRLTLRERMLDWAEALLALREALREMAASNLTTLLLATSSGQVVQPSSLGHYLAGHLSHLGRTFDRLSEAYPRINQSPLGAVSGVSTAMPVRRMRDAGLLGFDGVVANTFDAIAATDVFTEPVVIVSVFATELQRLVNDVSYWSRDDVGVLSPGDEFIHTPGAQPQRREPAVLDHLRSLLARLIAAPGTVASLLAGQQMLGSEAVRFAAWIETEAALRRASLACRLLTGVLRTSVVNRALFANRSHRGFSTSSELADLLTVDLQLPVNDAHSLAEKIVVEWTQQGGEAASLTTEFVDRIALREIGRELGIEQEMLAKCLSPKRFVERRDAPGGPAPRAVGAGLDRVAFALRSDREWLESRRADRSAARDRLRQRSDEAIAEPTAILRRSTDRES